MESRREFMQKVFRNEPVDRVPVGFWFHFLIDDQLNYAGLTHPDLMEKSLSVISKDLSHMMIPVESDLRCAPLNPALLNAFQEAQAAFPEMLSQLQANMTYSAPFEEDFDAPFG